MQKKDLSKLLLVIFMILFACRQNEPAAATASATFQPPENTATAPAAEETAAPIPPAPAGWLTYENATYGFYFYHPAEFEVLTDEATLYGWENAILLLYNGGQSYDIAVQIWESMEEMNTFYGEEGERLHAFPLGTQILSIMNITNEADSEAIIESLTIQ
jgi:hypothetical protein